MKISRKYILLCTLPLALVAGCSTTPSVKRIEAGGATSVSTMGVDVKDFKDAAGKMVETLLTSGALDKVAGRKAVINVGQIVNDSGQMFDTDQISFKITSDLMTSGKAQTITTYGKNATDKVGQAAVAEKQFLQDQKGPGVLPDFNLAGKILRTDARQGSTREVTYTFQLLLTDTSTGLAVWQNERAIGKQTTRPAVGF